VPYYGTFHGNIGRITAFAPGTKENAAIFCHAAIFMAYAYLTLDMPDEAYEIYQRISPLRAVGDMELFKSEPYVFPEYITGPGNTRYGEGAFTWLTGTCDWFLVAITQQMLGVKPEIRRFKESRRAAFPHGKQRALSVCFRGNKYIIDIAAGKENRILVKWKPLAGNIIKQRAKAKPYASRLFWVNDTRYSLICK